MKKQDISALLRRLHLAKIADYMRFYYVRIKNKNINKIFVNNNPGVKLPPDYLMYESFQLNYDKYYFDGKKSALVIIDCVKPYIDLKNISILDWGCGPARILRHLPSILGNSNKYYGCDYNHKTIKWCERHILNIIFLNNGLQPPLNYSDGMFNFIYSVSVLTHLSEENQYLWSKELYRVISGNGILYITTHGDAFKLKLTEDEIIRFDRNDLVSRGNVLEGHRMFGAFHPPAYIRNIFESVGFEILSHIPGKKVNESYISQDQWILKKN